MRGWGEKWWEKILHVDVERVLKRLSDVGVPLRSGGWMASGEWSALWGLKIEKKIGIDSTLLFNQPCHHHQMPPCAFLPWHLQHTCPKILVGQP